jgi:type I restriction enzyme S subunit
MADRSKYQRAAQGDIAYNMTRMWQGALGLVPMDGLVSPAYVVARPYPEVDAGYFAYLFRTADYMHEVEIYSRGIVPDRNRLYWDSFKQIFSPVPPVDEQRLIFRFLDTHAALTARVIRAKQNLIKLVSERREALTQDVVQIKDTPNTRFEVAVDKIFRTVSREAETIYIPIGLFNRGRGIFHKEPTKGEDLGDSTFSWIEEGDVVVSGQFAWEGAVSLAGPEDAGCIASHRYHILRGKPDQVESAYLLSFLKTSFGHLLLIEHSRGAAGRNKPLNAGTLLKEKIPIPAHTEQQRLVELVSLEKRLTASVRRMSDRLYEFRARLVADVVTGKLDVRAAAAALPEITETEPIDEPTDGEDLEEALDDVEDEVVAA